MQGTQTQKTETEKSPRFKISITYQLQFYFVELFSVFSALPPHPSIPPPVNSLTKMYFMIAFLLEFCFANMNLRFLIDWLHYSVCMFGADETMAFATMKPTKPGLEEPLEQIHKIRITLSSKNVKNLEKGMTFIYLF